MFKNVKKLYFIYEELELFDEGKYIFLAKTG